MAGSESPTLTREQIVQTTAGEAERVEVPEWGGAVMVRTMTADQKAAWEKSLLVKKRKPGGEVAFESNEKINVRVSLAIATVVDGNGAPLFTDADTAMLGEKSAAALERVFTVACRLNRIGKDDVATLEEEESFS